MTNENEIRIKEKLDFFMEERIVIHIKLKDKTFLNGIIIKRLKQGVYWFEDKKIGEVFLFLKDVYGLEKFKEVGV